MFSWPRVLAAVTMIVLIAAGLGIWFWSPTDTPSRTSVKTPAPAAQTGTPEPVSGERKPQAQAIKPPRFEKLDASGRALPDTAEYWDCVRDNAHGLVWEVKQNNAAVRDLDFTYSWYSAGEGTGLPDGGECFYINCDTQSLVNAVNREGLCGWYDWRLPTNEELMTLDTDRLYYDPDIDQRYFPNTRPGYYWTSTPANVGESLVWSINFLNGFPYVTEMRLAYHVRLVRTVPGDMGPE